MENGFPLFWPSHRGRPRKSASHKEAKYGDNKERRVVSSMEIKIFGVTLPNQCAMENEQNSFLSLPFQSEKHMM